MVHLHLYQLGKESKSLFHYMMNMNQCVLG